MAFGEGFKHEETSEMLEEGFYRAKITKGEVKSGKFGDYIQCEVEVEGHPGCNPHIFLLNDSPKSGFGKFTQEEALKMWNQNMTRIFKNFGIQEGDFVPSHWVGKVGDITVRQQKKNPQYNEIVPYKTRLKKADKKPVETTQTSENNDEGFPEDIPEGIF